LIVERRSQIAEVKILQPIREFRPLRLTSTILLLISAISLCQAQAADELIAKNLAARGGAEKLRAIQTMVMTGTIGFGGTTSPITVKVRRPNQIREEFRIDGADMVRAYNGA